MHKQSIESPTGGICCEPGQVFADCNGHSATAFQLYDLLHGTQYAQANTKWFAWMSSHFLNPLTFSAPYLFVVYNQRRGIFLPVGDNGADCWALGFGYPWFPETSFADAGWKHIRAKGDWNEPVPGQMYVQNCRAINCCGGGSLAAANAFVPLTAVQIEGKGSTTARNVIAWMDARYGRRADTDADGQEESYFYDTDPGFRFAATGLIAAALATDGDSLRTLCRTPRKDILAAPTLANVDYPSISVRSAEYSAPVLRFSVLKGVRAFSGKTDLVCSNVSANANVKRDGQPWTDAHRQGAMLVIHTDVDTEHAFEVAPTP